MPFSARQLIVISVCTLSLSACAGFGGPISPEDDPEEQRLRAIESGLEQTRRRLDSLSDTLVEQGGAGGVSDELRHLRGEVEQLRFELDRSSQRTRQLYQDLDDRLVALEGGTPRARRGDDRVQGSTDVAIVGSGLPDAGGAPQARRPAERDPKEEEAYMEAFELLKAGKYQDAILGFENVVSNWPNGRYTDTALYWAGESHYVLRNYEDALKKFGRLVEDFPQSSRVPDALLKQGFAYEELGQADNARRAFQRIREEHGQSGAASLAQQRLQRLSQ